MSNVPMREMTLNEYIGQLPECHRAYKEYRSLKAKIERKDMALREADELILRATGNRSFAIEQALKIEEVER